MLDKRFALLALLPLGVFVTSLVTVVKATKKEATDPEVAVQNVFRQILKIRPPNEPWSSSGKTIIPPKHMLELYQKYAAGGGPKRTTGSTVRSIIPTKGHHQATSSSLTSELLIFNVTCIEQTEEVHLAQLHLHRRRLPRHHHSNHYSRRILAPPYRVRLYQILQVRHPSSRNRQTSSGNQKERPTRARTMPLASVPVPQATRGGWHALDITPVLRELLLNAQGPTVELMLGVRFEAPKGRPISPENFLRDPEDNNVTKNNVVSPAFLVVFSEDSPDNGILDDGGENHLLLPPPHTHTMAELLQTAGGEFLNGVVSVPKQLLPITATITSINNKTKDDDFYIESSDSSYRKSEIDISHRHKHKSKTAKEFLSNSLESNSIEEGQHRLQTKKHHVLQEERNNLLRRRRLHSSIKYHDNEDKFKIKKLRISDKKNHKSSFLLKNNEVSDEGVSHRRNARSVLDNELPDDPRPTKSIPRTSPGSLLQGRKNGISAGGSSARDDGNTIPLPSGGSLMSNRKWRSNNRRRRGRGKKRGDHKKRSRKLPDNWHNIEQDVDWRENDAELDMSSAGDGVPTCRRHKLEVNFADIGWSDWIISPQTFEAHYCAGSCPFPLTKALKPTNHATIQSLVHAIGRQSEVPAPCCVPDHLSPMTLLYTDGDGNIVLKNYPAMSVDTCACR